MLDNTEQFKMWVYELYIANANDDKAKIKEILKDINERLAIIDGE